MNLIMSMYGDLRTGSLNVRGLNCNTKRNVIYQWVRENKYDICLLQETYCIRSNSVRFSKGWSGEIYHSFSNSTHSRGVAIMLSKKLQYNIISSHSDDNGRSMLLNLEIGGR